VSARTPLPALFSASLLLAFALILSSCGGVSTASLGIPSTPASSAPVPQFAHVFLLVEENHGYSDVIGNAQMPYLNGLASKYGLATQYYANTHPSIGNYFMLTTGQIVTNDDSYTGVVNADNVVRELVKAGKTWRSYTEGLPGVGYTGDGPYPYGRAHNPFSYLSDVVSSPAEMANLVPFSQFAADLASGQLPSFSFIAPDLLDDSHNGTLAQADTWLQQNIAPLISNPVFANSLLIIVFDEAEVVDILNGGGRVAAVIVSPKAKPGHQSTTLYQHQSTLRLILRALGVSSFPGAAANAPDMGEFF
jgi:phosphatidylinositol-3-phosphatase